MQKEIIAEYDYVRAITTLLVIIGHCTYYTISTNYGGIDLDIESYCLTGKLLNLLTSTIYSFHMPLFIALSGSLWFITNKQSLSFKELIQKKSQRLLVPFILTALFLSIPLKFLSGYWHEGGCKEILSDIILGQLLFLGNANSHLWFLQTLFIIFIMAYLIERYNMRQNKILFLLSLLLLSCIGNYTSIHGFNFLNIPSAMRDLFWFYTGFYFEENRERINSFVKLKLRNHFMITALVFIQIILVYFNAKLPHFIKYFTYYILAISGMFLTYTACYKLTFSGLSFHIRNSLRKVSKNSYDLYLFSDPFNYIFISLLGLIPNYRILFTDNNFILAIFLLRFLLTSCGAIMIIKSIRLFQNIIKNR